MIEIDVEKTIKILSMLNNLDLEEHWQLEILISWAWIRNKFPEEARRLFELVDNKMKEEPQKLYNELLLNEMN